MPSKAALDLTNEEKVKKKKKIEGKKLESPILLVQQR
jgi:hypothetical protein